MTGSREAEAAGRGSSVVPAQAPAPAALAAPHLQLGAAPGHAGRGVLQRQLAVQLLLAEQDLQGGCGCGGECRHAGQCVPSSAAHAQAVTARVTAQACLLG